MSETSLPRLQPDQLADCVGTELGVSSWITIDQARINAFADCTEDHQWIHIDIERALRERPGIGTVAHGYLTLSLLAPATFEILSGRLAVKEAINYGLDKLRFLNFVKAGSRVRNHMKVLSIEDKGQGRWLLTSENTVEIEGQAKPALVAVALTLLTA
jgi:acyl dehydratase